MRGLANRLIESYLCNRQQFVAIDDVHSSTRIIEVGVPQGSNIGPLLFLIYVNDIGKLNLKGIPRLFADDTALFYPGKSSQTIVSHIESDLKILSEFFQINLLSLNVQKTKYMIFHSIKKRPLDSNHPQMLQYTIEKVNDYKYLGIVLDPTLSWEKHIASVEKKVSVLCSVLKRVSAFVAKKALLSYYYACVHSLFQYLNIVWGNAGKSKLQKLQVLQNRCLKLIFKLPYLYPTIDIYLDRSHCILPIRALCELQTCIFIHEIKQDNSRHNNLTFSVSNHLYNTRQANQLLSVRASTTLGQKRITFKGPQKYNLLPNELKSINNKNIFKARLKQYLKLKSHVYL